MGAGSLGSLSCWASGQLLPLKAKEARAPGLDLDQSAAEFKCHFLASVPGMTVGKSLNPPLSISCCFCAAGAPLQLSAWHTEGSRAVEPRGLGPSLSPSHSALTWRSSRKTCRPCRSALDRLLMPFLTLNYCFCLLFFTVLGVSLG